MGQILLFCLLMLPIVGFSMWMEWNYEKSMQRSQLLNTVQSLAARQAALTRGTESLLLALSLAPVIQEGNPDRVFPYLVRFDIVQYDYLGIAQIRPDGTTVASMLDGRVSSVDTNLIRSRRYFEDGLKRKAFYIGEAVEIKGGGMVLPMTMPVINDKKEVCSLLMLPLSLDRQHAILDTILKQSPDSVMFLDSARKPVFLHPDTLPAGFTPGFFASEIVPHAFRYTDGFSNEKVFEFSTPDGTGYAGALTILQQEAQGEPYLYIFAYSGQLSLDQFLRRQYVLQLLGLSLVTFLLLYTSSMMGRQCFSAGLGRMADVALKTGDGTSGERCGELVGCREIVITGNAFDRMLDTVQASVRQLKELSTSDPLTGLWNRRQFTESALRAISEARRYGTPLALGMADIDHFKSINDTYGHAGGDAVLRQLAQLFRSQIRESDLVGRYGGEEFVFLFPLTSEAAAAVALEKLRHDCESLAVPHQGEVIRLTTSFGVAQLPPAGQDEGGMEAVLDSLIRRADAALYASKEHGRNRVTLASALE